MNSSKNNHIYYITRDIERALGIPEDSKDLTIISNDTPFAKSLQQERTHIVLISDESQLDTWQLLSHPDVIKTIPSGSRVIVYKNTSHIERICEKNGWQLLNPSAQLASTIEEKVSQSSWLKDLNELLPPHFIRTLKDVVYEGVPVIVQFNRAHSGTGTQLISSADELAKLQEKFPDRPVRISEYIKGPVFTSNNIVHQDGVICGQLSYQITGLSPFTDNPFATIGNDWGIVPEMLSKEEMQQCKDIAQKVGEHMQKDGYRGLFGIDLILDPQNKKLFLLEINARQPASVPYESMLQKKQDSKRLTTMDLHLKALAGKSIAENSQTSHISGAQIIYRNTEQLNDTDRSAQVQKLKDHGFNVISYPYNRQSGSEALRIHSESSVISEHNMLNKQGQEIRNMTQSKHNARTLSENAQRLIEDYKTLPFRGKRVRCPYYNNRASKIRGALRVHVGKGSIDDIIQEAALAGLKEGVDIHDLDDQTITEFLVNRNIGIDCSAFAFYVLDAELYARGGGALKRSLFFPHAKSPFRKTLVKLRPVENCAVRTLAHDLNSTVIDLVSVSPADMIIMLDTKKDASRNHILIVHKIDHDTDGKPKTVHYHHSLRWDSDGKYNHGVRSGAIKIIDIKKPLVEQQWIEKGKSNESNETYTRAFNASTLEIRRLKPLDDG